MADEEREGTRAYLAAVNDEGQYSIWLESKALPNGWRPAGKSGTKSECLAWIKEVWIDMTPASLRAARSAKV